MENFNFWKKITWPPFNFNIIKKLTKNLMEIFTKKFIKKKIMNYFTSYSNLKKQDLQVFRDIMKYKRLH